MSIRATANLMEDAAIKLSRRGRGFFGRREHRVHQAIEGFVAEAWTVPPGAVLPPEVRESLSVSIDNTIAAIEERVDRAQSASPARDTRLVGKIYALREAEEHLMLRDA